MATLELNDDEVADIVLALAKKVETDLKRAEEVEKELLQTHRLVSQMYRSQAERMRKLINRIEHGERLCPLCGGLPLADHDNKILCEHHNQWFDVTTRQPCPPPEEVVEVEEVK